MPIDLVSRFSILKGVVTDIQGVAGVSADHKLREEGAHVIEQVERLVRSALVVSYAVIPADPTGCVPLQADEIAVRKELPYVLCLQETFQLG